MNDLCRSSQVLGGSGNFSLKLRLILFFSFSLACMTGIYSDMINNVIFTQAKCILYIKMMFKVTTLEPNR